jgi:hypothetical protein
MHLCLGNAPFGCFLPRGRELRENKNATNPMGLYAALLSDLKLTHLYFISLLQMQVCRQIDPFTYFPISLLMWSESNFSASKTSVWPTPRTLSISACGQGARFGFSKPVCLVAARD